MHDINPDPTVTWVEDKSYVYRILLTLKSYITHFNYNEYKLRVERNYPIFIVMI